MTPLALLNLLQETLPPPPEPTGSPEIDTARVIGVVAVSLGVIVLVALAIRPLVVKPRRPDSGNEPEPQPETPAPADEPSVPSSIIPFPRQYAAGTSGQGPVATEGSAIQERLSRVTREPMQRRKLGDRQPRRMSYAEAMAEYARLREAHAVRERAARKATLTPIHAAAGYVDRRGSSVAAPADEGVETPPVRAVPSAAPEATMPTEQTNMPAAGGEDRALTSGSLAGPAPTGDTETDRAARDDAPTGRTNMPDAITTTEIEQPAPSATTPRHESPRPAEPQTSPLETPTVPEGDVDALTLGALHQLVRELIHCANTGDLLHGFALYSDAFLFRFMDGSGMTEDEFRAFYGSVEARPRDAWERLGRLFDVVRLPDGRIEATASYVDVNGAPANGLERYRFVEVDGIWMIDDIAPLESPN